MFSIDTIVRNFTVAFKKLHKSLKEPSFYACRTTSVHTISSAEAYGLLVIVQHNVKHEISKTTISTDSLIGVLALPSLKHLVFKAIVSI